MSLIWSSYVALKLRKGGGSKPQNCRFSFEIALPLKKVCYKVSFCEKCQRQSCKAFIRAKMIGGGRRLLPEMLGQNDRVGAKSPIFDLFSLVVYVLVTRSKKSSINTNRVSTTRFPMSPRWTSYVVPERSKTQNSSFWLKIELRWKKYYSAEKFLCVKTVSDKVVGHSLA